jgi:hypothetical protein
LVLQSVFEKERTILLVLQSARTMVYQSETWWEPVMDWAMAPGFLLGMN